MDKKIGLIGLGKMGHNLGLQMMKKGYTVVALNRSRGPVEEIARAGALPADSVEDLVGKLGKERVVWLMLPAGEVTDFTVESLSKLLDKGDTIIDGSNNYFKEDIRHRAMLEKRGISLIDAGCSGGPSGALNGMCIMAGGEKKEVERLRSLFTDLSVREGFCYTGGTGSGHFVKMVHNAIEYGMMQSIAEGVELMGKGPYGNLDLAEILKLWNHGSVIESRLVELSEKAMRKNPNLDNILPQVEDNGEGKWAAALALEHGVPFGSITNALFNRFSSRDGRQFGRRFLAALRHEFGGHEIKKEE